MNEVGAASNNSGAFFTYNASRITYQNNIVAKVNCDFLSVSVDRIDAQDLPATIAVGEELPLVITMERSYSKQFKRINLATASTIEKIYHDKIVALKHSETVIVQNAKKARDIIPYPFTGYKSVGVKVNVPAMKIWTLHMSQPVTNTYKPDIVVMNQYGDIVETTVDITGKKIYVQPPAAGYTTGETYYLKATFANPALNMSSKFTIE